MVKKKKGLESGEQGAQNILKLMDPMIVARLHQETGPTEVVVNDLHRPRVGGGGWQADGMTVFHEGTVVARVTRDLKIVPVAKP
jgi:hypothetical protein